MNPFEFSGHTTAYALGSSGVYFIESSKEAGNLKLCFFDLRTGQAKCLMNIPVPIELGLTLSPDECLVLYSQVDRGESDLMLVENYP